MAEDSKKPAVDKTKDKDKFASYIIESVDRVNEATTRLAMAEKQLETGQTAPDPDLSDAIKEFEATVSNHLSKLLFLGTLIGDKVQDQVNLVYRLLAAMRSVLILSAKYKKPSDVELVALFTEPLSLVLKLSDNKEKSKGEHSDLVDLLSSSAPTFGCLFNSDCASQLSTSKKSIEEFLSKHKGNSQISSTFIDTLSHLAVSVATFLDDKHLTGGLVWTGLTDFDTHTKVQTVVQGHQAFL